MRPKQDSGEGLRHPRRLSKKSLKGFHRFRRPVRRKPSFCHQYAYWWQKQYLLSVRRPEIPRNFRRTQSFSFASKNPQGFFVALRGGLAPSPLLADEPNLSARAHRALATLLEERGDVRVHPVPLGFVQDLVPQALVYLGLDVRVADVSKGVDRLAQLLSATHAGVVAARHEQNRHVLSGLCPAARAVHVDQKASERGKPVHREQKNRRAGPCRRPRPKRRRC